MNRKYATLSSMAVLCTAAVVASSAFAAEEQPEESINVNYVVADLARPDGAEHVYQRIRRAAQQVCHDPGIRDLPRHRAYLTCFDRAVDTAVNKVNSTALTALHRSKTHSAAG